MRQEYRGSASRLGVDDLTVLFLSILQHRNRLPLGVKHDFLESNHACFTLVFRGSYDRGPSFLLFMYQDRRRWGSNQEEAPLTSNRPLGPPTSCPLGDLAEVRCLQTTGHLEFEFRSTSAWDTAMTLEIFKACILGK